MKIKYASIIWCQIFHIFLYLQCHEAYKEENVKFITITKGVYYWNNMGEMVAGKIGRRKGRETRDRISIPTKLYHGNKTRQNKI